MAKTVKKTVNELVKESNEVKENLLSAEFSMCLQMVDDIVWIDNTPSQVCPFENQSSSKTRKIAQHDTNTESIEPDQESLPEPEQIENIIVPEWEKEVSVDQLYWEQKGAATQKDNNSRLKYPASQRLTVTDMNKIALHNTVNRDPSSFKFNIQTTALLNTLIEKKVVRSYQNILGKGNSAVVLHAHYPDLQYTHGMAVKVYKLSSDVKKNNAVLKRAKREYEHLVAVNYSTVPVVNQRLKNIIILEFLGANQEPWPCLSTLPSEYNKMVYEVIVNDIKKWYNNSGIVHGKLCAKSILYDTTPYPSWYSLPYLRCRPYIIGWGHSVKKGHPRALMKLMRDCYFVTSFFESRGVPVKSAKELFMDVTELKQISNKVLDAMYKEDLWQAGQLTNPNRQ